MSSTNVKSEISELGQKIAEVANRIHRVDNAEFYRITAKTSNPSESSSAKNREILISLLNDLLRIVQGPARTLIDMTNTARVRFMVMRTIIHFGLAEKLHQEDSKSFSELASILNVDQTLLERTLRFAFSQGIFQETAPGSGRKQSLS